jgi:hypothetical protein
VTAWVEAAPATGRSRVWEWAAREAPVIASLATLAAVVLATLPYQLAQDGWLSLVAGREIVDHGLPRTETLTALGAGREWIDQQWLAHVLLYGLARAGIGVLLAVHAAVLIGTYALGAVAARRLGGGTLAVAVLVIAAAAAAPWAWQVRAQTLALPCAVALLWLLASDARTPSRRVLLAVPLLVLWANLHGSVLLGAGITALAGLVALGRRRQLGLALLLAPAAVVASPYGLDLVGYYERMLGNGDLAAYVVEWQPTRPGAFTAVFYVLAAVALVAAARRGPALDRLLLPLLVVVAFGAIRNVVWAVLAVLVLVPALLARRPVVPAGAPMRAFAAVATAVAVVAACSVVRAPERVGALWPAEAAVEAAQGDGVVFADERLADWLLWQRPALRGRVALDARFELFRSHELEAVHDLYGGRGTRALDGASTVVLDASDGGLVRAAREAGFRRVGGGTLAVLTR